MHVASMPALAIERPQDLYARLMAARKGDPVEEALARMLSSWSLGHGGMPNWFGLAKASFEQMMQRYFPRFDHTHESRFLLKRQD